MLHLDPPPYIWSPLDCPKCRTIPHGTEIFLCSLDHDVCGRCFDHLPDAPGGGKICQRGSCSFSNPPRRNRTVEDILRESQLRLTATCANEVDGCPFAGSYKAVKAHESACQFSPLVPCPQASRCSARVPMDRLADHLKAKHGKAVVVKQGNEDAWLVHRWLVNKKAAMEGEVKWKMVMIELHGDQFGICMVKRGDFFHTWIAMFGEAQESYKKYEGRVSLAPPGLIFLGRGQIPSVRTWPDVIVDKDEQCVTMSKTGFGSYLKEEEITEEERKAGFDAHLTLKYEVKKI